MIAAALAAFACALPAHPLAGGPPLVWGIGPLASGDSGLTQAPVVAERSAPRDAALRRLAGAHPLVLRLNRLFESDGAAAIARYRSLAHHFTRRGFEVELQVRYHPSAAQNGDLRRWLSFVRSVVAAFGPDRGVVSLQIANEVNLAFSPNTSDGAFLHAHEALIEGLVAAKRAAHRYPQLRIGFNWADLGGLPNDDAFWRSLHDRRVQRAVDWVGIDTYPGTFPPRPLPDPRAAMAASLARLRRCLMPLAGLGPGVPIHIEETGWPTDGAARPEAEQLRVLRGFAAAAHDFKRSLGISDFRWFNLRDNNTAAAGMQAHFGLLHDDYSPKPAFSAYRRIISSWG
ncbi:MAG: hypothetical protein NVSMB51_08760 [Solirubrobacteraceae bacterium]